MYQENVLGKLPIMQHFMFGSLLVFEGEGGWNKVHEQGLDCVHALGQETPECCGIRIPSAIGARGLVPFD